MERSTAGPVNPAPCVFCSGHRDGVYLLKHDQLAALSCTLMSRHSVHLLYLMDKERKKQKKHTVSSVFVLLVGQVYLCLWQNSLRWPTEESKTRSASVYICLASLARPPVCLVPASDNIAMLQMVTKVWKWCCCTCAGQQSRYWQESEVYFQSNCFPCSKEARLSTSWLHVCTSGPDKTEIRPLSWKTHHITSSRKMVCFYRTEEERCSCIRG